MGMATSDQTHHEVKHTSTSKTIDAKPKATEGGNIITFLQAQNKMINTLLNVNSIFNKEMATNNSIFKSNNYPLPFSLLTTF